MSKRPGYSPEVWRRAVRIVLTGEHKLWEISYFLRGRLGTTAAEHSAGSRFVLLNRNALNYISTERYNLNQALNFRATSSGNAKETIISGQLVIEWLGVGRLGGRAAFDQSQYFTGFRVTVNGDSTDTTLTIADPGSATS